METTQITRFYTSIIPQRKQTAFGTQYVSPHVPSQRTPPLTVVSIV